MGFRNGDRGHVVIVGAGLAGSSAALALRRHGFDGQVTMVGEEPWSPYHRPPLSKDYLRGESRLVDVAIAPIEEYARRGIVHRAGTRAARVDARLKVVELDDGAGRAYERLPYDRLLVATGSRNSRLPVPGATLDGVVQLRTLEQSDRIRAEARPGRRAVIAGLGFIGCEVAASLRQLGVEVVAVGRGSAPLGRVLGERVGGVLADIHREHGVELALGDSVAAFEGAGRVERVRTARGRTVECDFAVVGVGIIPNVELLELAGAAVEDGILVDARCRTTLPDVYAAGDVTNHEHPLFGRLRVEHWNNAFHQGEAAALSMLDRGGDYDYLHSFWSDQYEHKIEYLGHAERWDRAVIRGSLASRQFLAFYLLGGAVRAVAGLNRGGDPEDDGDDGELKACAPLIRNALAVDPTQLEDETVALSSLHSC